MSSSRYENNIILGLAETHVKSSSVIIYQIDGDKIQILYKGIVHGKPKLLIDSRPILIYENKRTSSDPTPTVEVTNNYFKVDKP